MYIVIRLEGFGLLMLLLGRIETIMETCGLAETMETVYAPNIVAHRLEGKAYGELLDLNFLLRNCCNNLIQ